MLFLTIFRKFPTTFRRFPKIFQSCSKGQTNVSEHFPSISEHFPKITEDCRRRPKKIRRCFDQTPTHLSVVEGTKEKCYEIWYLHMWGYHIFTCEDIVLFLSLCYHSVYHWHLYNKYYFNVIDVKAGCYAFGGALKERKNWTLQQCDIDCCQGVNCNTQTPTLSKAAFTVFPPTGNTKIRVVRWQNKVLVWST